MVVMEQRRELRRLLGFLSVEQREVVKLRYYYGYSYKEIARMLNLNLNTALGRAHYARIYLRKIMPAAAWENIEVL
jgi:RNA polymerase sigma-70 factor (ECF subfamily)